MVSIHSQAINVYPLDSKADRKVASVVCFQATTTCASKGNAKRKLLPLMARYVGVKCTEKFEGENFIFPLSDERTDRNPVTTHINRRDDTSPVAAGSQLPDSTTP